MRTPRVYLPEARTGRTVALGAEDALHLVKVLRRGVGDLVEIVGTGDDVLSGKIESVEASGEAVSARISVGDPIESVAPILPWTIAVAPVKDKRLDLAIRQASELGLEALIPLDCERGEVRKKDGKAPRWERIARESAKQCGRARPMEVRESRSVRDLLTGPNESFECVWIAAPGASPPSDDAFRAEDGSLRSALFLIGPEGGFSDREISASCELGARPIGFPTPVLRTPTAVALVAALGASLHFGQVLNSTEFRVDDRGRDL